MTPWTAACQDSLTFTVSQSWFKLMPIESMMPSNRLIPAPLTFLLKNKIILTLPRLADVFQLLGKMQEGRAGTQVSVPFKEDLPSSQED